MPNEFVFLTVVIINLAVLLFAWRLGKNWLMMLIVITYLINSLIIGKTFDLFGFSATLSAITYSSIFIGTDILTEHYGKRAGYRVVWMGFFAAIFLVWMEQVALYVTGTPGTEEIHAAMETLFATSVSFFAVSLLTYIIAQRFDIWLYHFIHGLTKGRYLWLRNNLSTILSQALSGIVFGAFAWMLEIFPRDQLVEVMVIAYLMNLAIALFDTPVIYLSYWVRGRSLPGSGDRPPQNGQENAGGNT